MSANKGGGNRPPPKEPIIGFFGLLFSILCPTIIGWVIIGCYVHWSYIEYLGRPVWFPKENLSKPFYSLSYILIGAASYLVWKVGNGFCNLILPQSFNVIQLAASYAWFILFFETESRELGLAASCVQWVAALMTLILFGKVQKKSLLLTLPYLIWHGFVLALNIQLYIEFNST
ncbi:translocator protein-like [Cephus cinctus]|uniref:Translocator protein-like n=1 Tax=Cephus cinctus TaxID=211228 RepID=A0AAJ7RHK4_CEPCN|nr:translocator protein-like [Cephus cinctus]